MGGIDEICEWVHQGERSTRLRNDMYMLLKLCCYDLYIRDELARLKDMYVYIC